MLDNVVSSVVRHKVDLMGLNKSHFQGYTRSDPGLGLKEQKIPHHDAYGKFIRLQQGRHKTQQPPGWNTIRKTKTTKSQEETKRRRTKSNKTEDEKPMAKEEDEEEEKEE